MAYKYSIYMFSRETNSFIEIVKHNNDISEIRDNLSTLNGDQDTPGSVRNIAKSCADVVDAKVTALSSKESALESTVTNNKTELDGKIQSINYDISGVQAQIAGLSSVALSGTASDIALADTRNLYNSSNAEDALQEIALHVEDIYNKGKVTLQEVTPGSVYAILQDSIEVGRINIPKDLVATKGELVSQDGNGHSGMFIKMTIANGNPFYIPVSELVDTYIGNGNLTTVESGIEVKVTDDLISATIKSVDGDLIDSKSITLDKLTQSIQDKINKINTAIYNITEGSTNGTISVDGTNVSVHGLGSAAYTASTAYDPAGSASQVKVELLGTNSDTATSKTIEGLIKKSDATNTNLNNLQVYVGQIPVSSSATDIVSYISEQLANQNNFVRFDETQNITDAQKTTARNNIGAASQTDLQQANTWKSSGAVGNYLTKDNGGNLSWGTLPKAKNHAVIGTQVTSTSNWTGNIDIDTLEDGLTITYILPVDTDGENFTLNLTLNNNIPFGEVPIYAPTNQQIGGYIAAGTSLQLTYYSRNSISFNGTSIPNNRWICSVGMIPIYDV